MTVKKFKKVLLPFIVVFGMLLVSCGEESQPEEAEKISAAEEIENQETNAAADQEKEAAVSPSGTEASALDLSEIPAYTGNAAYTAVNGNIPDFSDADMVTDSFEIYSELDALGRCGTAYANVGTDIMPTEERGSIGQIKPTGWHTVKYDSVDGKYLYNRCHLIGYQLTAENANERNLITGTRYLNVNGMLPFENMVADYVKETNNHVLYRVRPVFDGDNLVASGVQIEAKSVEDDGEGILFNVFCYNVQPDIRIDYATGESSQVTAGDDSMAEAPAPEDMPQDTPDEPAAQNTEAASAPEQQPAASQNTYILNTNTKKFHYATCRDVNKMKDTNKQEYTGNRDEIVNQGYEPCKHCNP